MEEKATELYFQLASVDRKRVLAELMQGNLHLYEVAKRLETTPTEALRQLQRLTESGLLEKMPDGKYRLTSYAKLVLDTASPLDFISRYKEYFQEHDAFLLPKEFRARFGELSDCRMTRGTIETLNWVTEFFKGAQKKIDATVVGFEIQVNILRQRVQEGLKVRWLMDASFSDHARLMLRSDKQRPEVRVTPRVFGHVGTTDKAAVLTLRHNDGTLSFDAFVSEDPSFLKWAGDLFAHEWERAKPWYP